MGFSNFLKWLDKHVRESNGNATESYRTYVENEKSREIAEKKRLETLECCANCYWFKQQYTEPKFSCSKHGYCFDAFEVTHRNVHYEKYCADFWRK